jgi:hypothetical protein
MVSVLRSQDSPHADLTPIAGGRSLLFQHAGVKCRDVREQRLDIGGRSLVGQGSDRRVSQFGGTQRKSNRAAG